MPLLYVHELSHSIDFGCERAVCLKRSLGLEVGCKSVLNQRAVECNCKCCTSTFSGSYCCVAREPDECNATLAEQLAGSLPGTGDGSPVGGPCLRRDGARSPAVLRQEEQHVASVRGPPGAQGI